MSDSNWPFYRLPHLNLNSDDLPISVRMMRSFLRRRLQSLFILLILSCTLVQMPVSDVVAQGLNFKIYGDDVLPTPNIYTAFQDSKGYMWFGSDRGVIRYDGYVFSTFTREHGLSDDEIFQLFEDSSGRIWFETMNGKVSYFKDGVFWNSLADTTLRGLDCEGLIAGISEDEHHNIWFTSRTDILCYTPDRKARRYRMNNVLTKITSIKPLGGNNFIVMTNRSVYKLALDPVRDTFEITHDYKCLTGTSIAKKYLWLNEDVMLIKDPHRIFSVNVKENTCGLLRQFELKEVLLNLSKTDDNIWVGAMGGAFRYDLGAQELKLELEGISVTAVTRDSEGNYWFTTYGNGIYFCTSMEIASYSTKDGLLTDKINCLKKDSRNRLWIGYGPGSNGAISYIDRKGIQHRQITVEPSLQTFETNSIDFHTNNDTILSTSVGAFLLSTKRKNNFMPGFYRVVSEHSPGKLWIAGSHQLYALNREKWIGYMVEHSKEGLLKFQDAGEPVRNAELAKARVLDLHNIKCILLDRSNTFWISTDRKLYTQTSMQRTTKQLTPMTFDFAANVNDLKEMPEGSLVMATDGDGLAFVKNGRQVMTLTTRSGMSSNVCTAIDIEKNGTIWVGTTNGVNKITGYPDSIQVDYLSVYDGLLSNHIVDVEVVNDTVWVASRKGLSFFPTDYRIRKMTAPIMYIERVTLDGEPVFTGDGESSFTFNHRQNDIGIRYVGLLYGNGDPLLYRYRLHDTDPWRYTKSTSVYLPGLNPDTYQFTVSAQGRSGQWSEEARVTFKIRNPFWRTNVFIVGMIVLVLGVGGWTVRRYINNQQIEMQRQQRVVLSELKTLRAQMNPHFLFNALNSIQGVLLKKNIEGAQEYLIRFGKLMRLILDHSDRASITIKEELDSIVNYLEIEQLRSGHQFHYRIEFDSEVDIERSEIPAMILQPFIENSIWHGFGHKKDGSELLVIRFSKADRYIIISITDNGIGRKKALAQRIRDHKSKGIQLVSERIEILNFNSRDKIELDVKDLEDEEGNHPGTCVTIKIPLPAR